MLTICFQPVQTTMKLLFAPMSGIANCCAAAALIALLSAQAGAAISLPSLGDLSKLTASEIEALIAEQRRQLSGSPKDNSLRSNLGWITIEAANRILQAESLGHAQEAADYANLIRTALPDTLWRVTQLVHLQAARANAALGVLYSEGILAPRDAARACRFFATAAGPEHAAAAYRAWQCTAKTDPERSRQWLEQSANAGHAGAQEAMGRACVEGASIDAACAKKWLESSSAQGRAGATSLLAWLYAREGGEASLSRAVALYRTAAEAGDLAAQNNLGELYETGRGAARDPAQALEWYRKSAERGFAPAQFNLARLLAFGMGTERDTERARDWATKAQAQGVAKAGELLRLISDAEKR